MLPIADFIYSRETFERVFAPLVADLRYEYAEALAKGLHAKARWIEAEYWWAFLYNLFGCKLIAIIDKLLRGSAGSYANPSA
jgi:hypothetical protein